MVEFFQGWSNFSRDGQIFPGVVEFFQGWSNFSRGGRIFPGMVEFFQGWSNFSRDVQILILSQKNVNYQKLLCVKTVIYL